MHARSHQGDDEQGDRGDELDHPPTVHAGDRKLSSLRSPPVDSGVAVRPRFPPRSSNRSLRWRFWLRTNGEPVFLGSNRGTEDAAFIIQQNLRAIDLDASSEMWTERIEAYEVLTGMTSPAGRMVCPA